MAAAAAALGAVVGIAVGGGDPGAVMGATATPLLLPAVRNAVRELRERREINIVATVALASDATGDDPDAFLRRSLKPETSRLLSETLQAAAAATDRQRIEALARALANGVADTARVDEEIIIVRALADLDPIHARTLAFIAGRAKCSAASVREWLLSADGGTDLTRPILAVLERHGLVQAEDGRVGQLMAGSQGIDDQRLIYRCTRFGSTCLNHLGHSPSPGQSD